MTIKYLIDENQRGVLWHVIQKHNARGINPIDAIRVGDPIDLPLRSSDSAIIEWSANNSRLLVTFDKKTMPGHFYHRLSSGLDHPGVFMLRSDDIPVATVSFLAATAYASLPEEWRNAIHFIP